MSMQIVLLQLKIISSHFFPSMLRGLRLDKLSLKLENFLSGVVCRVKCCLPSMTSFSRGEVFRVSNNFLNELLNHSVPVTQQSNLE